MPTYKVPAPKKRKSSKDTVEAYDEMEWMRRVTLPVNDAILDAVDIDDRVVVALECDVKALEKRKGDRSSERRSLDVVIRTVSVYTDDKMNMEKMFKDK